MKDKLKVITLFVAVMLAWGGLFYALTNAASTVSADEGYPVDSGYPIFNPCDPNNLEYWDICNAQDFGYPVDFGYPEPVPSSPEINTYSEPVQVNNPESPDSSFNLWRWIQSQFAKLLELMK